MPSIPLSRRPAVLLAVFFSFAAVFLLMLLCMGWTSAWHHVAIPAFPWPYFDMRLVQSAPQALAAGLDPRLSNPGDIVQRPMDYPIV